MDVQYTLIQNCIKDQNEHLEDEDPGSPEMGLLKRMDVPQIEVIDYDEEIHENHEKNDCSLGFDHEVVIKPGELTNITNNEIDDSFHTINGRLVSADVVKESFMDNKNQEDNEKVSIPVEVINTQDRRSHPPTLPHYVCLAEFKEVLKSYQQSHQIRQDVSLSNNHNKKSEDVNNNTNQLAEHKNSHKANVIEISINGPIIAEPTYVYFYTNTTNYTEIFRNRKLNAQPMFCSNRLVNGIVLLATPPSESDEKLLQHIYGDFVPVDRGGVQCFIQFRLTVLNKYANRNNESNNSRLQSSIVKVNNNKYICLRSVRFDQKPPKHDFRFNN